MSGHLNFAATARVAAHYRTKQKIDGLSKPDCRLPCVFILKLFEVHRLAMVCSADWRLSNTVNCLILNMSEEILSPEFAAPVGSRIGGKTDMAERIRNKDWTTSSFGPIATWSETLVATVNLMLAPNTFAVFWGPDGVLLYNDEYSALFMRSTHRPWDREDGTLGPKRGPSLVHRSKLLLSHETITKTSELLIPIFR